MMRTSILLPFCIALLYPIIALANEYTFDLDIVLPDKNNKDHNYYKDLIHDPARTYLSIYSIENDVEEDNKNITDSINFKFISNFHSDKDGVYHIKLPDAGKYQMIFQSLDLFFASSSQFQLTITDNINENENETEIIIQQFLPGLHKTLQEKLPYIKTTNMETPIIINGAQFHIGIKQYLQQDVGGLVTSLTNTIPFLGTIMNNRWLKITAISMIVMAKQKSQLFNLGVILYLIFWYSISSLTAQLTKSILNDFDFPIFVGEFQFFFNFLLGFITIYLSKRKPFHIIKTWLPISTFPKNNEFQLNRQLFKLFFPMGTFQFIGKLFSLAATSISPIATVSSIRALSPLFIILGYRIHYRVLFSLQTYLSLIPLLLGVIIIVISQSNYLIDSNSNQISIYNEQLDNSSDNILNSASNLVTTLENTIDSNPSQNGISLLSSFLKIIFQNKLQLHGIFYALLSTSIFAAGSIYTKNVITNNNNNNNNILNKKGRKEIAKLALFSINDNSSMSDLDIEKNKININKDLDYLDNNNINNISNDEIHKQDINIDKLTTLMYCSLYGLAYSIPAFMIYELPNILFSSKFYPSTLNNTPAVQTTSIPYYSLIPWSLLILNGISYFVQSLLAFHILGMLPTVTYSIANMMKRIIVITISILVRGHPPTLLEGLGLFHVSCGLYIYEKWGSKKAS
ncbi:hypothetical protein C6P40_001755 [Pichia californica]|uniref:Sugar phosphate transporter domain-containing protein n=1 Tax=Pichia californica TaxID=460514 RepID=A0A9P7BEH0_9ASCO|nr:hypothetical protein C6P42_005208 [[Candida] californica]KAG0687871.1 hypothetical protein C6P40_001755 [[Candida] californica]